MINEAFLLRAAKEMLTRLFFLLPPLAYARFASQLTSQPVCLYCFPRQHGYESVREFQTDFKAFLALQRRTVALPDGLNVRITYQEPVLKLVGFAAPLTRAKFSPLPRRLSSREA
jgi:hypothetical protein